MKHISIHVMTFKCTNVLTGDPTCAIFGNIFVLINLNSNISNIQYAILISVQYYTCVYMDVIEHFYCHVTYQRKLHDFTAFHKSSRDSKKCIGCALQNLIGSTIL